MNTRSINCLVEVPFIPTSNGLMTVREVLIQSHDPRLKISKEMPGFMYTSLIRFLASIVAVVVQQIGIAENKRRLKKLASAGFSPEEVDQALSKLRHASDLYDEKIPFMQQPALPISDPKHTDYLGKGKKPVKKLIPSMPSNEAEVYWNLHTAQEQELPLETALLHLITFHFGSMVGNNKYFGRKCLTGAPAYRSGEIPGTRTEILWEGESILKSLFYMIPEDWAEGTGLPAWADRLCERSRQGQDIHPLWAATWSSNAAATAWENTTMIGVQTGGVPNEWYIPEMGSSPKDRDRWTDARDERDSFYLYLIKQSKKGGGKLTLQHVDLGKDSTALAVEWAAKRKTLPLRNPPHPRLLKPAAEANVLFVQHRIEGSATSPIIRFSEIAIPSTKRWSFDADPEIVDSIAMRAALVQEIHGYVCAPFRAAKKKEPPQTKRELLDFLRNIRPDVSAAFWRKADFVFTQMLREVRRNAEIKQPQDSISTVIRESLIAAADDAFDEAVAPFYDQKPAQISYTRSRIHGRVVAALNATFPASVSDERKDS